MQLPSDPEVALKTTISLVWSVTGMLRPVVVPLVIVPIASTPVNAGARVTMAPGTGVKVSSGLDDSYSWALSVTVVPTSDIALAVLA